MDVSRVALRLANQMKPFAKLFCVYPTNLLLRVANLRKITKSVITLAWKVRKPSSFLRSIGLNVIFPMMYNLSWIIFSPRIANIGSRECLVRVGTKVNKEAKAKDWPKAQNPRQKTKSQNLERQLEKTNICYKKHCINILFYIDLNNFKF